MKTLTFDTETTGVDTTEDRIIELCIMRDDNRTITWRIKPLIPIKPTAQEVHGISMDDLKDMPTFVDLVKDIVPYFEEADVLIGYNVGFDINMISEEFERSQVKFDLKSKLVVDPLKLWYHHEKRNLEGAYEYFTGKKLEGAHAAEADVIAAKEVLDAMRTKWNLMDKSWEELADICDPDRHKYVGTTHHFIWDEEGRVLMNFGKHKGERAYDNRDYLKWMLRGTFPSSVKNTIKDMFDGKLKKPQ